MMNFTNEVIREVWRKAIPVMNQDPAHVQKDKCGAWIVFEAYGNRRSEYGWEIDHIIPVANGGTDDLENLQPLHWDNNVAKGSGGLVRKVTADGIHNKVVPYWNLLAYWSKWVMKTLGMPLFTYLCTIYYLYDAKNAFSAVHSLW